MVRKVRGAVGPLQASQKEVVIMVVLILLVFFLFARENTITGAITLQELSDRWTEFRTSFTTVFNAYLNITTPPASDTDKRKLVDDTETALDTLLSEAKK